MRHLSDNVKKLQVRRINDNIKTIKAISPNVEFVILPFYKNVKSIPLELFPELVNFILNGNNNSTFAVLTSPICAAEFCSQLSGEIYLKLWIAVKMNPVKIKPIQLIQNHSALLILTKNKKSLKHTKTRIGYSYCSTCERTIKDYGGKKHLYHEFGTLISDVWRNINLDPDKYPQQIIDILKDLFGLPWYSRFNVYDQRKHYAEKSNKMQHFIKIKDEANKLVLSSKLINDDCITELKKIPDNSIDFCFADPPYNLKKKYENWDDGIDIKEYFNWCDNWFYELGRVLKPGRTLAVLNIPQWTIRYYKYLKSILDFQDWIVWEGLSLPVRMIMPSHYSILCFSKGKPRSLPALTREKHSKLELASTETILEDFCARPNCIKNRFLMKIKDREFVSNLWWNIHRLKHNSRRADHPCQLPQSFMHRIISLFTYENEIVLDPFNGVGTSSLSAQILNRKYIGIELSPYYHGITVKRHEELSNGLDPFRKIVDNIPNAKNSRVERLKKQIYRVSKKELQLEIKRIRDLLGKIPDRNEVIQNSRYPIEYYDKYFMDWGEVTAAARTTGMTEYKKTVQRKLFPDI